MEKVLVRLIGKVTCRPIRYLIKTYVYAKNQLMS